MHILTCKLTVLKEKVNSAFNVIVIGSCTENQPQKQRGEYYLSPKEFMMLVYVRNMG